MAVEELIARLFSESSDVRYVAVRLDGALTLRQRPGIAGASSSESDRYEELLVNPTLLTLLGQRGDIDCGGLEFALLRYGNFFQFVCPWRSGHVSVSLEPSSQPLELIPRLRALLERWQG